MPDGALALRILEALPIPLFLFKRDRSLLYANSAGWQEFSEVLGVPLHYGDNLNDLLQRIVGLAVYKEEGGKVLQPDDAPVMQAIQTGKVVQKIIKRYIQRTGAVKWYVNLGIPIHNEQGEIAWSISANVDITAQQDDLASVIASLGALKAHAADMDVALRQNQEWLVQTNDQLSSTSNDLQQFIHMASHDLKEPVRKIRTYTSKTLQELRHSTPDMIAYQLQRIDHATSQLFHMINGVQMFSGIDAQVPEWSEVELQQVVHQAIELFEHAIQDTGAAVTVVDLPTVWGIPYLLQQLFTNLISNALKFTRPDIPARVHIAAAQETVESVRFWVLSVADNGIGIPEQYRSRIFQPFKRLHAKSTHEGAGLGLSICQKIAAYHGGTIKVCDNEYGGATFLVYLPLQPDAKHNEHAL